MGLETIKKAKHFNDLLQVCAKSVAKDFYIINFEQCANIEINDPHAVQTEYFEIVISKRDHGQLAVDEKVYDDLNNAIGLLSPGQLMTYKPNFPKQPTKGFCILFKSTFLGKDKPKCEVMNEFPFFRIHSSCFYKMTKGQINELYDIAKYIYGEADCPRINQMEIVKAYLIILLCKFKQFSCQSLSIVHTTRQDQITSRFEQLVIERLHTRMSISEYASILNISTIYLSECVKRTTNKTPKQILIDYQITKIKSLLLQTEFHVSKISLLMGFNEVTNFTKFFKKHTGVTPMVFRNKPCFLPFKP